MLLWQTDLSRNFVVVDQAILVTAQNPQVHTSEVHNPFIQDTLICIIPVDIITSSYFGGNTPPNIKATRNLAPTSGRLPYVMIKGTWAIHHLGKNCGNMDMKTLWMGLSMEKISLGSNCVTSMHHMMHSPLLKWNVFGSRNPHFTNWCVSTSWGMFFALTSMSSEAFFLLSVRIPT